MRGQLAVMVTVWNMDILYINWLLHQLPCFPIHTNNVLSNLSMNWTGFRLVQLFFLADFSIPFALQTHSETRHRFKIKHFCSPWKRKWRISCAWLVRKKSEPLGFISHLGENCENWCHLRPNVLIKEVPAWGALFQTTSPLLHAPTPIPAREQIPI